MSSAPERFPGSPVRSSWARSARWWLPYLVLATVGVLFLVTGIIHLSNYAHVVEFLTNFVKPAFLPAPLRALVAHLIPPLEVLGGALLLLPATRGVGGMLVSANVALYVCGQFLSAQFEGNQEGYDVAVLLVILLVAVAVGNRLLDDAEAGRA